MVRISRHHIMPFGGKLTLKLKHRSPRSQPEHLSHPQGTLGRRVGTHDERATVGQPNLKAVPTGLGTRGS